MPKQSDRPDFGSLRLRHDGRRVYFSMEKRSDINTNVDMDNDHLPYKRSKLWTLSSMRYVK